MRIIIIRNKNVKYWFKSHSSFAYTWPTDRLLAIIMMIFPTSRPFSFSHLTDLLSLVTSNALARWPRATYLMNSDVAWRLPGPKPEDDCATLKYTTRNLIETEDGIFASYCIGLIDPALGVGSIEPVGTRPAFRRMGLGQQVNYEGLHRMKEKGMHSAKIGTAGFNDPALACTHPAALIRSTGNGLILKAYS